jgi:hypothetical protein
MSGNRSQVWERPSAMTTPALPHPAPAPHAHRAARGRRAAVLGVLVAGLVAVGAACSSTATVASGPGSTAPSTPGTTPGSIVEVPGSTPTTGPTRTSQPPATTPPGSNPKTPTTAFVPSPPPVAAKTEDGAIYLALIRTSIDRTRRDPSGKAPYAEIVIVDHGVPDAGEGTSMGSTGSDGPPFSPALRADLEAGLGDLGPVHFAPSPKAVAVSSKPGEEHVLVIAGPIEKVAGDGTTVHVGLSKTCGPMCGSGGTDILQKRDGQWVVTGATGSGWIS